MHQGKQDPFLDTEDLRSQARLAALRYSRRWLLEVSDPPRLEIVREAVPAASVGKYLRTCLRLTTASIPALWSVSSGRLPPGLQLDARSGSLYGIPTHAGVWCSCIRASVGSSSAVTSLVLVVRPSALQHPSLSTQGQSLLENVRSRHFAQFARAS